MEWHELGRGAEPELGLRSQRIIWGGCDPGRNSLGCGNSLSLSQAADADRAKAPVSRRLRSRADDAIAGVIRRFDDPGGCGRHIYGLGTTLQPEPSQCWMIELLIIQPTAHTSSLATAAASFIKKLSGAGTMVHELPSQCSARVCSPWATSFPIAQRSFGAIAVTVANPSALKRPVSCARTRVH